APLFPAFPLHFLSIAPSQSFPLGSRIPVSIELSPTAPQSFPTGSKICISIEFSAISPKPPQQPFSTGSKMRADVSAGPKSGFKMRAAVFKWL
ncbi:MAG TPA: hypothetical protein PLW42_07670, partial [Anaerohalosphaeraceae bacterium]|nr:hypothetical protein [Anaerohalosphaeraceae bacterium]